MGGSAIIFNTFDLKHFSGLCNAFFVAGEENLVSFFIICNIAKLLFRPAERAKRFMELAETKDKTDYNLCAWTEIAKDYVQPEFNTSSNLAIWWQESGGTLREFQEKMRRKPFLNDYEVQNLKNAGINVKKDMTFLRMSKALLGQCIFSEITGTMNMLERTEQLNSPYRYLIGAVHNEIKNTAKEQHLFPEHI